MLSKHEDDRQMMLETEVPGWGRDKNLAMTMFLKCMNCTFKSEGLARRCVSRKICPTPSLTSKTSWAQPAKLTLSRLYLSMLTNPSNLWLSRHRMLVPARPTTLEQKRSFPQSGAPASRPPSTKDQVANCINDGSCGRRIKHRVCLVMRTRFSRRSLLPQTTIRNIASGNIEESMDIHKRIHPPSKQSSLQMAPRRPPENKIHQVLLWNKLMLAESSRLRIANQSILVWYWRTSI